MPTAKKNILTLESIREKRNAIQKITSQYGAHHIRIFGSIANHAGHADSDVDFLIDLDKGRSLLDLGGLQIDLQNLLGCKVDLVTEKGLHWYLKDKILQEAKPL
jgi:predicted nucleotidyltransferase